MSYEVLWETLALEAAKSTDLGRMHSGRYWPLYEIRETHIQVAVLQLGRTA
ncbi:hypothetical protein [Streptomyces sp. 150FB]|uniref:hypothetical protein n=1 Tax=Streptomyces sp. 150FB TaxID=1576605 RepID=UPI000A4760C2|nr:hypothetical protein [Streptomyces sp. 150FB]